jgi:hypothetical protein
VRRAVHSTRKNCAYRHGYTRNSRENTTAALGRRGGRGGASALAQATTSGSAAALGTVPTGAASLAPGNASGALSLAPAAGGGYPVSNSPGVSGAAQLGEAGEPIGSQGRGLAAVSEVRSWAQSVGRAVSNGPGVVPEPGNLRARDPAAPRASATLDFRGGST